MVRPMLAQRGPAAGSASWPGEELPIGVVALVANGRYRTTGDGMGDESMAAVLAARAR